MRVTENTNFESVRNTVNRSKEKLEGLQTQASTLKRINVPSDDPVGSIKVLEARTEKVLNDQFVSNARLAEGYLNNIDHVLAELGNIVVRAKEIAIGQASGPSSNEDTRYAVSEEVGNLYLQAISIANMRVGDRYLFSGFRIDQPAVDANGNYMGDDGLMNAEVARGTLMPTNMPGFEVFNTVPFASQDYANIKSKTAQNPLGAATEKSEEIRQEGKSEGEINVGNRAPASLLSATEKQDDSITAAIKKQGQEGSTATQNVNLFNELQNLRIALISNHTEGIQNTLENFDALGRTIVGARAKTGARVSAINNLVQTNERRSITSAQISSSLEDADMAKVLSDLSKEEAVFKSALATSGRLMQPTLLDFLK